MKPGLAWPTYYVAYNRALVLTKFGSNEEREGGSTMRVMLVAGVLALAVGAFAAMPAAATPDNKNTFSFDVSCDPPLQDVTTVSGNGSGAVFTEDGQVLLAKRISGVTEVTISVEGGPTIPLPPEPFEAGAKGKGFEGRLTTCTFTQEFVDTFTLKKKDLAFLELGQEFLGATATITGTTTGTADVMAPGS
jgi:hypothetical protein